ncbi:response regulator (plasmid) [Acaryochloris sp. 'Moss Beach']|uniref:response regulator n=1 Tax=Acaryochloris TaxID=155977 RepID=UPI001BAFCCB9|nr:MULTISPECIES: response regulator [Acaryochloris]QUY45914.1 response regulator [Acaryochloris marina S15]UJB72876.1 response regulator [Acaryochloris sp. 'Moss Beach']
MKTVLVVDDSPAELKLMCLYLKEAGYLVVSTDDAKDALSKAETQKPDLVITDVVMPEMSGFELCRSLKKNEATQQLPVIICTTKNQDLDKLWGRKQGADEYITKPYTREDFLKAVKSAI